MVITFVILLITAILFVHGKIRSDIIALCSMLALMVLNIITPEQALSGFSNSVVIMMAGLFIVGGAIFKTGLAKIIGSKITLLAGNNETKLFILIMLATAFIGAFVSNTGTVALMLPIVVSTAVAANVNPSRYLMPLAFASSMGGMMTLIGTPPNLVIAEELAKHGYNDIGFFSFTPVGLICIAIGIIVLLPLSKIFLSKRGEVKKKSKNTQSSKELVKKYQLFDNLYRLHVQSDSLIANQKVRDLNSTQKYNLNILEVRRSSSSRTSRFMKTVDQNMAGPNMEIKADDILYVFGAFEDVEEFAKENKLEITEAEVTEYGGESSSEKLSERKIGIAEILLRSESQLINKTIKESNFRKNYSVNILGIQRKGKYILNDIKDIRLHDGDVLLVQGTWEHINLLSQETEEWVVVGQPMEEASKVTLDYKAPVAAVIMILMIIALVINVIPPVATVTIAAILMVFTGCFRNVEEAYKTINWESIILIAAMLPMSAALETTGASELISKTLVTKLGELGPTMLLAGIYLTTSLLTMFINNTATAVLVAPIAFQSAHSMGVSPYPFLMAVTVGASMCFASPFSTPPNALVMNPGKYKFTDYIKVGLPLQVIIGIIMVFALPLIFPF
ncbi:MAG: SLC13 family permease [Tannerella sp.]|jgi:di/tricarboxylate transporter|nr:SLC13 family permease [Tannerella sp.]